MIRRGFLMSFFRNQSLSDPRKPGFAGSYIRKGPRSLPQAFLRRHARLRLCESTAGSMKCHSVPSPTGTRIGRSDPGCKKRLIPSSSAIIRTVGAFGKEACPEYELSRLDSKAGLFPLLARAIFLCPGFSSNDRVTLPPPSPAGIWRSLHIRSPGFGKRK